ncbi:hypothetical protein CHLNCDRAFT_142297 [Chlorella variabilis]|uniref:Phospholipid/glycerol acyltransferase domain-containing protein n=1 Tax=Chlorella variabilis TaxID=554065 RepID=E1Z887_CHLVA|nr:hypothetical protein CHLNCDRAFT_142297 [Chlorella variabilis]EFN58302.1 hypothetical protein CHLNCDRAFT_142297 [Chlorella variabilis]|eukprot:XP_005850404.1 hypothetical protein CHLNCDRAFT_142297 [Chlorella variabilis]
MLHYAGVAARSAQLAQPAVKAVAHRRQRRQRLGGAARPRAAAAPGEGSNSNSAADSGQGAVLGTPASSTVATIQPAAEAGSAATSPAAADTVLVDGGTSPLDANAVLPTAANSRTSPAPSSVAAAAAPAAGTSRGTPSRSRPHRMRLQAVLEMGDGPPRVVSLLDPSTPLAAAADAEQQQPGGAGREHLPLLLYLPGIDGTGLAASRQFPSLLTKFDMRTFVTPPQDRTPFPELVRLVADFLRAEVPACAPTRPVYVLGESFGGLLALAVAAEVPALVDRLVPAELYRALPLALAPVLGNPINLLLAGLDASPGASVGQQAAALVDTATNLLQQLPVLAEILPADTLAWKLELLRQGSAYVGDQDLLLPSGEEGARLQAALPRTQLRVERGRSHALLQEGGVDLAAILQEEGFYTPLRRMSAPISKRSVAGFGVAAPIELPTPGEIERYAERTTAFGRRLSSPVFISTGADGRRSLGLGQIPEGRPLLLVGNHQTLALDLGVITEQFLKEQGVLPRGLAHPVIFAQTMSGGGGAQDGAQGGQAGGQAGGAGAGAGAGAAGGGTDGLPAWDPINGFGAALQSMLGGDSSSSSSSRSRSSGGSGGSGATDGRSAFRDFMTTFGAVPVSAFNMHRLLQAGESVLLFPGGVREAYKRRGEEYRLFWPEKSEFIRMAARFGATIVPFAAVGVDDSLNILADSQQLEAMPVVGDMLRRRAGGLPQARRGVSASGEEESFVAPLAVPRLPPGRLYFLFQQPIHTSPDDLQDRERCDELYRATRQSVEDGLAWLQRQRQRDPYKDFLPRQLYEAAYRGRQAPTFPLN